MNFLKHFMWKMCNFSEISLEFHKKHIFSCKLMFCVTLSCADFYIILLDLWGKVRTIFDIVSMFILIHMVFTSAILIVADLIMLFRGSSCFIALDTQNSNKLTTMCSQMHATKQKMCLSVNVTGS